LLGHPIFASIPAASSSAIRKTIVRNPGETQTSFVKTSLSGKVVWLTGASSGIGESLAYALAEEGANLVLTARREPELNKVKAACKRPHDHLVIPLDLIAPEAFQPAVRTVLEHFGRVDVLINNAGISQRGTVVANDLKVFEHLMALNFFAPVQLTKLVLPSMIERKTGHIVAISSLLGKFGAPGRSAYCSSKHAIIGFCDSLRAEVYRQGVAVTVVCPGFVRTNASYNALEADGTPHGKLEDDIRNGIPSDVCAQRIIAAIKAQKREVYIGKENYAVYLNRFMPGLFSRLVRRRRVK
jgi:short-subunit dehydrogenase